MNAVQTYRAEARKFAAWAKFYAQTYQDRRAMDSQRRAATALELMRWCIEQAADDLQRGEER